ncbi:MAG: hypothetical protein U0R44_01250 [Candidatus Micrarchaeia archaeon]
MKDVTCCPRCKRLIEAKDYMNPLLLGMLDSILPKVSCRCGYNGLPIVLSREDYGRWIDQ